MKKLTDYILLLLINYLKVDLKLKIIIMFVALIFFEKK